jgi:hypothetical protein
MRLEPLYQVRYRQPEGWAVGLAGPGSAEGQYFFLPEGRCTGALVHESGKR